MRTILAVALFTALASAQDPLADLLRKGIVEEDSNHNLNAAIQAYQLVLDRFNKDREAAATALFRIAECYRKQGKQAEAAATYRRLIQDFGEQNRLVQQSRRYLPAPKGAAASGKSALMQARSRYRELLLKGIETARQFVEYRQKQYQLGATSYVETYDAERQLTEAQRALAGFDSGIEPQPLAPPADADAAKAREQYRSLLQKEVDLAQKDYESQTMQYKLGAIQEIDLMRSSKALLDAQLQLAAFDMNAAASAAAAKK